MANDLTNVPLLLDTAAASHAAMSLPAQLERRIDVTKVYWKTPVTIADTFSIQDKNGRVLLEGRCEVANVSQIFQFQIGELILSNINGWFLQQISSGKLEIYGFVR